MKRVTTGLLALCLLLLCSCSSAIFPPPSPSPSYRGTLPSQEPTQSQAPDLEESAPSSKAVETATPSPTPKPTPEPTPAPTPTPEPTPTPTPQQVARTWVLNTNTRKIHYPSCSSVSRIAAQNYATSTASIDELLARGYTRCGRCF